MAAITQQSGAVIPGQRYGSFAGKEETLASPASNGGITAKVEITAIIKIT